MSRAGRHALREDIAVMLLTKQYSGSAWRDYDVWHESVTDEERDDALETAEAILSVVGEFTTLP